MLLVVDIGNTNIVLGLFNDDKLLNTYRIVTDRKKKTSFYKKEVKNFIKISNINIELLRGVIISNVVPEIKEFFLKSLDFLNVKIIYLPDGNIKTNIILKKNLTRKIGTDIIANIVAGVKFFKENFIIIDMGTATTFDIVINNGEYVGSIIAPGASILSKSLHEFASQLPLVQVEKPSIFLLNNTIDLMKSGIYYGCLGMIKEIISKIKDNYRSINFKIFMTGGLANIFINDLKFVEEEIKDLTLIGLKEIWKLNAE